MRCGSTEDKCLKYLTDRGFHCLRDVKIKRGEYAAADHWIKNVALAYPNLNSTSLPSMSS